MSTSDQFSVTDWQPWYPDNLVADNQSILPILQAASDYEDTESEVNIQAELASLRQNAERKGLEQGQARGYEEGRKAGYDEGMLKGLEEGRKAGESQMDAQLEECRERMKCLLGNMQNALEALDSIIPSRLLQIALSAARTLFGKSVVNDSTNVLLQERITQLLNDEPLYKEDTQLWVSKEDLKFVASQFNETLGSRGWSLAADENMLPGGCRIASNEGEIDETLEIRWQFLCNLNRDKDH